jgi:hypothetical protein
MLGKKRVLVVFSSSVTTSTCAALEDVAFSPLETEENPGKEKRLRKSILYQLILH